MEFFNVLFNIENLLSRKEGDSFFTGKREWIRIMSLVLKPTGLRFAILKPSMTSSSRKRHITVQTIDYTAHGSHLHQKLIKKLHTLDLSSRMAFLPKIRGCADA